MLLFVHLAFIGHNINFSCVSVRVCLARAAIVILVAQKRFVDKLCRGGKEELLESRDVRLFMDTDTLIQYLTPSRIYLQTYMDNWMHVLFFKKITYISKKKLMK